MKTKMSFFVLFVLLVQVGWGQEETTKYFDLSFGQDSIVVYDLLPGKKQIVEISIAGKFLTEEIERIKIEKVYDGLPKGKNRLSFDVKDLDKFTLDETGVRFQENVYLTVEIDSLLKRDEVLLYQLMAVDSMGKTIETNMGKWQKLVVLFKKEPKEAPLKNFEYLSYIGTNFDLVEGVKADNLFFATNIFSKPTKGTKDFGFYLSLYGNRTMSTKNQHVGKVNTEIVPVTIDSSYRVQKTVQITKISI